MAEFEKLATKRQRMLRHNQDLANRETEMKSMQISHEELVNKVDKEKQQLKARVEEVEVDLARQ